MIEKYDFWEQKSKISKPTMKNKVIGTMEQIAREYNISISSVLEKLLYNELDYKKEYEKFYNNVIKY